MALPLESVPNFSAASDSLVVAELAAALGATTTVLNTHSDLDHNRSVFTITADADGLVEGLFRAAELAVALIDIREHKGVHPMIGALDVAPIVPLAEQSRADAHDAAHRLARRLAGELSLPVFLYGELTPEGRPPEGQRPAFYRRGGLGELTTRIASGELSPDYGPAELHVSAGATLVGVRKPLIAFNVNLATDDVSIAREIAAEIRETGGGFDGVRALGLKLETQGIAQVSMNIEDWQRSAPHHVVAAIEEAASRRGVEVLESELIGLMPAGAALAAGAGALRLTNLSTNDVLELRLLEETMLRQQGLC